MLKAGYNDSFVLALIINASDIAFLIPPSIGMIIYGVVSGTSISELFIAGIGPGPADPGAVLDLLHDLRDAAQRADRAEGDLGASAAARSGAPSGRWASR